MAPVLTDTGRRVGCYIVSEAVNIWRSRDQVTLSSGASYSPGQVLGVKTADGEYAPLATSGTTGAENAAAICFGKYDATAADKRGVVHSRECEVNGHELMWPVGISDNAKAAAIAALAAKGIIVRY